MNKKLQKSEGNTPDHHAGYFCTYDLGCSAALISAGFELISLDKENRRKVQFIFQRENGIEKVVNDYWADSLRVKTRTFFNNVKMLKNRIYSE